MSEKIKIVGFQSGHDVSYCILENGIPIIHEELERFTREKEPLGDGLEMFFKYNNDDIKNISHFSLGNFGGRDGKWQKTCGKKAYFNLMHDHLKKVNGTYSELSHHMCHAANAFFSSNFKEAAILTIDGGGNESNGMVTANTIYQGKDNKIKKIKETPISKLNIGWAWDTVLKAFDLSTGYPFGNQAGTVMAMASLGNHEKYSHILERHIHGEHIRLKQFILNEQDKYDISAGLQKATENVIFKLINDYIYSGESMNLCISGGCALNSVLIGKIQDWFPKIKSIYVPPVPYDAGLAIGSAQYVWHQILNQDRIVWKDNCSPYLGRKYSKKSIMNAINQYNNSLKITVRSDDYVLNKLIKRNIISVYGGGSESGRRALGNRSILADPRSSEMKNILNKKVKHRQWFRPFAPSILRDEVKNWFKRDVSSPYMTHVLKWKDDALEKVPSVVHINKTARLQTVAREDNEWFYQFLKKWHKKSGVPILLNTSFNDREPIVESPENAIACFLKTKIDFLYFFEFGILLSKK